MLMHANQWLNSKVFDDVPHPKTGATALHIAAAKGYIKVIKFVILVFVHCPCLCIFMNTRYVSHWFFLFWTSKCRYIVLYGDHEGLSNLTNAVFGQLI